VSRPPARRAAQAGFTFVELIMGIVLAAIFAGALYGFFFAGLDAAPATRGCALPASVSGPQARDVASVSIRLRVAQRTGVARTTLELATDVALRNAIRL
jgi:prepilin-type N-terminal cleavage/methylation domain-containing protein